MNLKLLQFWKKTLTATYSGFIFITLVSVAVAYATNLNQSSKIYLGFALLALSAALLWSLGWLFYKKLISFSKTEFNHLLTSYFLDKHQDAMICVGRDGKVFFTNETAKKICPMNPNNSSECQQKIISQFDYPNWNTFWDTLKSARYLTVKSKMQTKTGQEMRAEISGYFFTNDGEEFCCVFIQDISQKVALESAVESLNKATSRKVGRDFFMSLSKEFQNIFHTKYFLIAEVNPVDQNAHSILFTKDSEILPNLEYTLVGTPCENVKERGVYVFPKNIQTLFPQSINLVEMHAQSYVGAPLISSNGTVIGVIAIIDTKPYFEGPFDRAIFNLAADRAAAELERIILERQLNQAQKLDAIGTLAGGIAHDFNNILMAMNGNIELIEMVLEPDHEVLKYTNNLRKGSTRAKDLVKQILTFSRKQEIETREICLRVAVEESVSLLRAAIPSGITIEIEDLSQDAFVSADPTSIQQVMMNLCTNASHAVDPVSGKILIKTESVSLNETDALKSGLQPGDYVRVSVKDNGHGIDEVHLKHIFDPFFTTKEVGKGTGLGLSVVHGIITKHNGSISVESRRGIGTEFKFYLPKLDTHTVSDTVSKLIEKGSQQSIMIVDDEEAIGVVLATLLESLDYKVTTFTNPREALEHFKKFPSSFDLLITDYTMPSMTGEDLIRKMHECRTDMKYLLTSGLKGEGDFNFTDIHVRFLNKPYNVESLSHTVAQCLSSNTRATSKAA